jgi:hypothetical protein
VDKSSAGISEESFFQKLSELGFVSEERACDVDAFATNDDDSLTCVI